MHIDQKYIISLQQNDHKEIQAIYRLFADKIKRMILANRGTEEEAEDVFQEALIDIYKMSADGKFVLTCPFEAFLVIVCKRKWLNVLKIKDRLPVTNEVFHVSTYNGAEWQEAEQHALKLERENLVMHLLEQMDEKCKVVIKACMSHQNQMQVAESLGFTYAYLRKKKSQCMAALGKRAKEHPLFRN